MSLRLSIFSRHFECFDSQLRLLNPLGTLVPWCFALCYLLQIVKSGVCSLHLFFVSLVYGVSQNTRVSNELHAKHYQTLVLYPRRLFNDTNRRVNNNTVPRSQSLQGVMKQRTGI